MEAVYQMYRSMYWSQIFNHKTSFSVKWRAMRSLWIMRKFSSKSNECLSLFKKLYSTF